MAQSLGPLIAVLIAYKSKDPYRSKWLAAVKRDLSHIPHALDLCSDMVGRRSEEIVPALNTSADVVLIAGARNAQRAFFPLNFLMAALGTQGQLESVGINSTESSFQIRSKQVFAGKRVASYIEAFYKHMNATTASSSGLTLPALAAFYRKLKVELLNKKDDHHVHGTVPWRCVEGLTPECHGALADIQVHESGHYFCGRAN
ncbi:hypothetical protein ACJJTC_018042 [Scirpophaga incertulas]